MRICLNCKREIKNYEYRCRHCNEYVHLDSLIRFHFEDNACDQVRGINWISSAMYYGFSGAFDSLRPCVEAAVRMHIHEYLLRENVVLAYLTDLSLREVTLKDFAEDYCQIMEPLWADDDSYDYLRTAALELEKHGGFNRVRVFQTSLSPDVDSIKGATYAFLREPTNEIVVMVISSSD